MSKAPVRWTSVSCALLGLVLAFGVGSAIVVVHAQSVPSSVVRCLSGCDPPPPAVTSQPSAPTGPDPAEEQRRRQAEFDRHEQQRNRFEQAALAQLPQDLLVPRAVARTGVSNIKFTASRFFGTGGSTPDAGTLLMPAGYTPQSPLALDDLIRAAAISTVPAHSIEDRRFLATQIGLAINGAELRVTVLPITRPPAIPPAQVAQIQRLASEAVSEARALANQLADLKVRRAEVQPRLDAYHEAVEEAKVKGQPKPVPPPNLTEMAEQYEKIVLAQTQTEQKLQKKEEQVTQIIRRLVP